MVQAVNGAHAAGHPTAIRAAPATVLMTARVSKYLAPTSTATATPTPHAFAPQPVPTSAQTEQGGPAGDGGGGGDGAVDHSTIHASASAAAARAVVGVGVGVGTASTSATDTAADDAERGMGTDEDGIAGGGGRTVVEDLLTRNEVVYDTCRVAEVRAEPHEYPPNTWYILFRQRRRTH